MTPRPVPLHVHPRLHGADLIAECLISAAEAREGVVLDLAVHRGEATPTELRLRVPASVAHGAKLRCNGLGLNGGHLYVVVQVDANAAPPSDKPVVEPDVVAAGPARQAPGTAEVPEIAAPPREASGRRFINRLLAVAIIGCVAFLTWAADSDWVRGLDRQQPDDLLWRVGRVRDFRVATPQQAVQGLYRLERGTARLEVEGNADATPVALVDRGGSTWGETIAYETSALLKDFTSPNEPIELELRAEFAPDDALAGRHAWLVCDLEVAFPFLMVDASGARTFEEKTWPIEHRVPVTLIARDHLDTGLVLRRLVVQVLAALVLFAVVRRFAGPRMQWLAAVVLAAAVAGVHTQVVLPTMRAELAPEGSPEGLSDAAPTAAAAVTAIPTGALPAQAGQVAEGDVVRATSVVAVMASEPEPVAVGETSRAELAPATGAAHVDPERELEGDFTAWDPAARAAYAAGGETARCLRALLTWPYVRLAVLDWAAGVTPRVDGDVQRQLRHLIGTLKMVVPPAESARLEDPSTWGLTEQQGYLSGNRWARLVEQGGRRVLLAFARGVADSEAGDSPAWRALIETGAPLSKERLDALYAQLRADSDARAAAALEAVAATRAEARRTADRSVAFVAESAEGGRAGAASLARIGLRFERDGQQVWFDYPETCTLGALPGGLAEVAAGLAPGARAEVWLALAGLNDPLLVGPDRHERLVDALRRAPLSTHLVLDRVLGATPMALAELGVPRSRTEDNAPLLHHGGLGGTFVAPHLPWRVDPNRAVVTAWSRWQQASYAHGFVHAMDVFDGRIGDLVAIDRGLLDRLAGRAPARRDGLVSLDMALFLDEPERWELPVDPAKWDMGDAHDYLSGYHWLGHEVIARHLDPTAYRLGLLHRATIDADAEHRYPIWGLFARDLAPLGIRFDEHEWPYSQLSQVSGHLMQAEETGGRVVLDDLFVEDLGTRDVSGHGAALGEGAALHVRWLRSEGTPLEDPALPRRFEPGALTGAPAFMRLVAGSLRTGDVVRVRVGPAHRGPLPGVPDDEVVVALIGAGLEP